MSFEKEIREENFSNLPVIIFAGGKNTRLQDLAYLHLLPSKAFLPIDSDEKDEICLFWKNFETLLNLGVKEFYFVVSREGKKVEEYFKRKFKEDPNVHVQYLTKETISQITRTTGLNIYIFKDDAKGTGNALLALENVIKNRAFVMVFGDEYFGGEVKKEFKNFINYALQKITAGEAVKVHAFIEKDKLISEGLHREGIPNQNPEEVAKQMHEVDLNKEGKVVLSEHPNYIITSLSVYSTSIITFLKEAKGVDPLDVHSLQVNMKLIEEGKFFGKVIDVAFFSNTNTSDDYFQLKKMIQEEKRVKDQKEKSEFKSKIKI